MALLPNSLTATTFLICLILCWRPMSGFSLPETQNYERQPARLIVIESRSSSSLTSSNLGFQIQLEAFDQLFSLKLERPVSTIFTAGFTFNTHSVHRHELDQIEKNIFVDYQSNSALHVIQRDDGEHQVKGYVNGMGLHFENGEHYIHRMSMGGRTMGHDWCGVQNPPSFLQQGHPNLSIRRNSSKSLAYSMNHGGSNDSEAVVEVQAAIDRKLATLLGDRDNMTIYMGILFHAANVIFAELQEPTVKVKIAGIYVLTEADNQEVIDTVGEGVQNMMYRMMDWIKQPHDGLGPSDLVTLFTGTAPGSSTLGTAQLGMVCNPELKLIVCVDFGAFWFAANVFTHELGHSLGAEHDFDTECGEQGNIMGYRPGTPSYFHWSKCSKKTIQATARSNDAACLFKDDSGSLIPDQTKNPGDDPKMTLLFQCTEYVHNLDKSNNTTVFFPANENPVETICSARMVCRFSYPKEPDNILTAWTPTGPAEGTICNQSGGRCKLGLCV